MATYNEFKQQICRIFGYRMTEENENDISIHKSRYDGSNIDFVISNSELQELYDRVMTLSSDNMELYSDNTYEIAVDLHYPMMRRKDLPIISEDISNGIKYILGFPSIEYCAFLLIGIIDARKKQIGRRTAISMRITRSFEDYFRFLDKEQTLNLQSLLPQMMRVLSIKIGTDSATPITKLRKYKTSFVFQFIFRSGLSLVESSSVDNMLHMNRETRERVDLEQLTSPPLREYMVDVVDYYKLASSTSDPYIKFISFYHVMEYYYDEIYKKRIITDLREKITNPGFSYKNDEKNL